MSEWYETKEGVIAGLEKYPRVLWEKDIAKKILDLWSSEWAVNVVKKGDKHFDNIAWEDEEHDGAVASHEIAINIAIALGIKPVLDTSIDDQAEHFSALTLENVKNIKKKMGVTQWKR